MSDQTIIRALDSGEAFFFMADRVSCMNFVLIAERSAHLDPARIRAALAMVQQENPLLRAKIVWSENHGLCFAHGSGEPMSLECHDVSADDWLTWVERELEQPFDEGTAPLARCVYLQFANDNRSVLLLCFHHSIADGRSGNDLMRRLLDGIATGASPNVGHSLLPPMSQAFPPKFRWAEQEEAAEQVMDGLMADYKRHGYLTPFTHLVSAAPTRTPRIIRLNLPAEVTARLLQLARQHGTSVHGALCAAQLLAQFRLSGGESPATFFLSCPVDMRPHLEPALPTSPIGLYTTLISAAFVLETSTDLWELARQIITQTKAQLARGEGHLFFSMYGLDEQPILPDRMKRFSKTLLGSWQNTMVSNIGQVAPVASDPAVDAISFALCPMPYQTMFNAVSTYRNQMILNVGYDEGKLSAETANAMATTMRELLLTAAN